jgi:hypothetical protein
MSKNDREVLKIIAKSLGDFCDEFVFVGGITASL